VTRAPASPALDRAAQGPGEQRSVRNASGDHDIGAVVERDPDRLASQVGMSADARTARRRREPRYVLHPVLHVVADDGGDPRLGQPELGRQGDDLLGCAQRIGGSEVCDHPAAVGPNVR
jgi:hypothetical protein